MCTAITFPRHDHYFGRTLDYECSFGETITITPRNYPFRFRHTTDLPSHYAIIGMARVEADYPLYFDAVNETGLGIAGLNFPLSAVYFPPSPHCDNIAPYELIPWILGQCSSVAEARPLLARLSLANTPFSTALPLAPLHWLLADHTEALVLESTAAGLRCYDAPVGVLTNEPPFPCQMLCLADRMSLSSFPPKNHFPFDLTTYSRGMGGMGLPGDLSSASRFLRAAFTLHNAQCDATEDACVSQFFHILGSVMQPRGCVSTDNGQHEITRYTACCNTTKGIYYYTTYENSRITAVNLHREDLESNQVITYPLVTKQDIFFQN